MGHKRTWVQGSRSEGDDCRGTPVCAPDNMSSRPIKGNAVGMALCVATVESRIISGLIENCGEFFQRAGFINRHYVGFSAHQNVGFALASDLLPENQAVF